MENPPNPVTGSTPEQELIICIARRALDAAQRQELRRLLQQPLDFDYLCNTASAHGLLPLLHKHLGGETDLLSGYFLSRLKRESVANSQSVLHLVGKQLRICRLFREHGMRVASFKGPVLAQSAYGEISLRQAGDIDLLIERRNFDRARSILESLGYAMFPRLTPSQLDSHLHHHCELQFVRDDFFTVVDLHWELAPRSFVFNLKADEVLARLQSISLGGTTVETFDAEDSVLYQSMHGAKHLWRRLERIASLAETVRSTPDIRWEILLERAGKAHALRMLALGLRLVEEFSDVPIPSHVLAKLDHDESMQHQARSIRGHIFLPSGIPVSTETNLYNLRIMDRKRDALASALRAIFVPTFPDWQALTLPASLNSLYYALRPLRLSKVYGSYLWRRVTRNV